MEFDINASDKICRACLCESANMKSLFTNFNGEVQNLLDKFTFITNINIKIDDELPKQVCSECEVIIHKANEFKQRCLESEVFLNNVYPSPNHKKVICENYAKHETNYSENVLATTDPSNSKNYLLIDTKERVLDNYPLCIIPEDNFNKLYQSIDKNVAEISLNTKKVVKEELTEDPEIKSDFADDFDERDDSVPFIFKEEPIKDEKTYKCKCKSLFNNKEKYKVHLKRKCTKTRERKLKRTDKGIPIKNEIPCSKCNRQFSNVSSWKIHQQHHSKDISNIDKPFQCSLCARKFKNKKSLAAHIRRHQINDNIKHTCEKCKREFKYKSFLENHILTMHSKDGFSCEYCMQKFTSSEDLEKHRDKHKTEKKHQCNVCNKVFTMLCTLKDHVRIHTGEKPFLCSICGKGFSQKTNLAQHMKRHMGFKPFKCENCEKRFVSKGELEAHNRKHSGAHPFVCDDCGNGFTTSSALVKHRRIHTGERPYACDLCPMRFAASGTLKNHRRTHTGERPFQCSYCEKAFVQRTDLVSHIRCHTGERPYICTQCGQSFRKASALKTHVKMHGKESINVSVLQGVNVLLNGIQ